MPSAVAAVRDLARREAANRAKRSLWWLATEILGYDKLTPEFHKPMLDRMDVLRRERAAGKGAHSLWIWGREHFKTTCRKAQVLQDLLYDPTTSIAWWHLVEEKAEEVAVACGRQVQDNAAYRALLPPEALPSRASKRFVGAHGFRLPSSHFDQAQTFRAWGVGSEATGGHSRIGYIDDPMGPSTLQSGGMEEARSWYRQTVIGVVDKSGWLNASLTRWAHDDLASDWLASPYWRSEVRATVENETGAADLSGTPTLLTTAVIRRLREEMGPGDFAMQMQNDATPASEIPWNPATCEHYTDDREMSEGQVIVLSDPAPSGVMMRADGEKDFWALAAVKIRKRGEYLSDTQTMPRKDYVLLWGEQSQNWTLEEGWRRTFEAKRRFGARLHLYDRTGPASPIHEDAQGRIGREMAQGRANIHLESQSRGRNELFAAFCDLARSGRFLIDRGCPEGFLSAFLFQCRRWRPLPGTSRNGLKHDDAANAVAFAADPAIQRLGAAGSWYDPRRAWGVNSRRGSYGGRHLAW